MTIQEFLQQNLPDYDKRSTDIALRVEKILNSNMTSVQKMNKVSAIYDDLFNEAFAPELYERYVNEYVDEHEYEGEKKDVAYRPSITFLHINGFNEMISDDDFIQYKDYLFGLDEEIGYYAGDLNNGIYTANVVVEYEGELRDDEGNLCSPASYYFSEFEITSFYPVKTRYKPLSSREHIKNKWYRRNGLALQDKINNLPETEDGKYGLYGDVFGSRLILYLDKDGSSKKLFIFDDATFSKDNIKFIREKASEIIGIDL